MPKSYVILGAGVVGLTTALELRERQPECEIIIVAKHLPGDRHPEYASPWAGANWLSGATDNGRQEEWDRTTYMRLQDLSARPQQTGVRSMPINAFFDSRIEDAGVLSEGTNKIWYSSLGNLRNLPKAVLPAGAEFGYELDTFVIDTQRYLPWYVDMST